MAMKTQTMASSQTPAKVPYWIRRLFPTLEGLEENPLYLRLSGQRFVPKPTGILKWVWGYSPVEFRRPKGFFFGRMGVRPILLIASPFVFFLLFASIEAFFGPIVSPSALIPFSVLFLGLAFFLGVILIVVRMLGGGISRLRCFLHNAAHEPWGEAIFLSRLEPTDYGRAVFAASLQMTARTLAFWTIVLLSILGSAGFLQIPLLGAPSPLSGGFLAWFTEMSLWALAVSAELFMILAMSLSLSFGGVPLDSARKNRFEGIFLELGYTAVMVATLIPGAIVLYVWNTMIWKPEISILLSRGSTLLEIFVFVSCNLPLQLMLVRWTLEDYERYVGKTFGHLIRSRYGD